MNKEIVCENNNNRKTLCFYLCIAHLAINASPSKTYLHILLNKSLARILISYPGLNEYEIFYLV